MFKIFYKKEVLKIVILVIFSISLTLLCLESTFRIIRPIKFQFFINHDTRNWLNPETLNNKVVRPSTTLGYELIPNSQIGPFKTNSLGIQDPERQKQKPSGIYRIICLGDSTTANSKYVRILEELLNKNNDIKRFEVWNCGVPGYGCIQYCRALQEKWLKCDPDMVIIGFCLNDFDTTPLLIRENNMFVGYFPYKEIRSKINPLLLKHSALYRFIITKLFFSKKNDGYNLINVTKPYLKETRDLLLTKNIRFMIVILGFAQRFENYDLYWKTCYKEIKRIVNDYNIDALDIVPIFSNNNPESLGLTDEIHFNQQGSQIVAEALYAYLKQDLEGGKNDMPR